MVRRPGAVTMEAYVVPGRSAGPPGGVDQLGEVDVDHGVELTQVGDLEGLDDHLVVGVVHLALGQGGDQRLLQREADGVEVGRVLGLRVDTDALPAGELEHLVERGDAEVAVVRRVVRSHGGQPLDGAQRPELLVGEVLGEPAGDRAAVDDLGGPAVGELGVGGDIGGAADLVLVAGDEDAVAGRHQVGLDVVGALPDGQLVGRQGVLGAVAGGAAVADHHRVGRQVGARSRLGGGGDEQGGRGGRQGDGRRRRWSSERSCPEPSDPGRRGRERGVNVR